METKSIKAMAIAEPLECGVLDLVVLAVLRRLALPSALTGMSLRRTAVVPSLALTALLAVAMPAPAQAQDRHELPIGSGSTLVSNRSQTISSTAYAFADHEVAQAFTTGSNPGGYALETIELIVADTPNLASEVVVEIRTSTGPVDARVPGSTRHVLTNLASFSVGPNAFRPPSGATLASGTTYFVVVGYEGSALDFGLIQTNLLAEDPGGDSDWSIANGALSYSIGWSHGTIEWSHGLNPLSVTINGRAAPATINTPPTIISPAAFVVDENRTQISTVTATDNEDPVFYAITGGADVSQFEIDETTGVLTFTTAPGRGKPTDVSSTDPTNDTDDREYIVTVTATGGTRGRAMTDEQTLVVTVVEEDEPAQAPKTPTVAILGSMGLGLLGLLVLATIGRSALPSVLTLWSPMVGNTRALAALQYPTEIERDAPGAPNIRSRSREPGIGRRPRSSRYWALPVRARREVGAW